MKHVTLALVCGLLLAASPLARATTVLKVGIPQMTHASQWIVRARIERITPVDLRPEGRGIFTDIAMDITATYKGVHVPKRYTMRVVGGTAPDGMTIWVPGMPKFVPGEDVVLFLEKTSLGHIPSGLEQGVWRVTTDPHGQTWVRQDASGAWLVTRGHDGHLHGAAPQLMTRATTLADLVRQIQAARIPAVPPGPVLPGSGQGVLTK